MARGFFNLCANFLDCVDDQHTRVCTMKTLTYTSNLNPTQCDPLLTYKFTLTGTGKRRELSHGLLYILYIVVHDLVLCDLVLFLKI